jgi:two-component system, NtrC family, nitrogen regulation sensor histidine kinase NtrY
VNLRRRLVAYLAGLHLIFLAFTLALFLDSPLVLVGLEVLLVASFAGGLHLAKRALEPLSYTRRFHDLLQDQDYAARLLDSKDAELNELVKLFNSMLGALYQERLMLGEQRGFLERLLEATPSAVIVFDFDGRITLYNASAQQLLGLENAKGLPLAHWVAGEAAPGDSAARRRRSLVSQLDALPLGESRLLTDADGRRYRGQRGHFTDRGFARHFLLVEELTEELESSERATYEKLVRVLAHEVNNTVAATGSVLESLLFYASQLAERDSDDFRTAIVAVKRRNVSLGEFIERFTRVAKMPAAEPRPTALAGMLDDIVALYREPCRARGVALEWTRRDEVAQVEVDPHLMEQALINIVKNAMEAAEASGGYIHLELAREEECLRLSVIDSGNRLGEVEGGQLFTPFFTTKKGGQGIGLLFVREVLNRHALRYRLAPNGRQETQFDIWFPQ